MSGIAQFISKRGIDELKNWCEDGYQFIQEVDRRYGEVTLDYSFSLLLIISCF